MTLTQSLKTCFVTKLFTIQGRASRSEYWWFVFFLYVIYPILWTVITAYIPNQYTATIKCIDIFSGFIFVIPEFTVSIRRIHDLNKSGFWVLLLYVILILLLLIFFTSPSSPALLLLGCVFLLYSLALKIYFMFPGTKTGNKYGSNQLTNTPNQQSINQMSNMRSFNEYTPFDVDSFSNGEDKK